jgi:Antirestriction protein
MADDKKNRKPFHEEFAEKIIEDLKRGVAPWQKPWRPGEALAPMNPVSGTVYSGINRVMLSRYGFDDPRWMTLRQANTLDCRVRKGEKAETIVYWQFSKEEPARDDDGKPVLDDEGNQRSWRRSS